MEWHFLNNQFDNATETSFRLMLTVTNDHYAKLLAQQADPDILILLNRTAPVHDLYLQRYSGWKGERAFYKGATQTVDTMLESLSGQLARQWDTAIMVQYDLGTTEHTVLLPSGREPLQQGTKDERIAAVKTLGDSLDAYPPLATLKGTVDGFYSTIKAARDAQQMREQTSTQASTDLEVTRKAIATMMYRNLGSLMDKFGETPDNILNYFEVSLLQQHPSKPPTEEEYSGTVAPSSTVNILQGIATSATVILTNTGTVPLNFCESSAADLACGIDSLVLAPGAVIEAKANTFNNPENSFLNVTNNDATTEGSYNMEVITPA